MGTFDDLMAQDAPRKAVGKEKGMLAAQSGVGGAGAAAAQGPAVGKETGNVVAPAKNDGVAPVGKEAGTAPAGEMVSTSSVTVPAAPSSPNGGKVGTPTLPNGEELTPTKELKTAPVQVANQEVKGKIENAGGVQPQASTLGAGLKYEEMYRKLNPYKPPTEEELEKERKKRKRQEMWAAIGDGVSALSNLYFTTQGAPNAYQAANNQSEAVRQRWEKLSADREAKMKAYIDGLTRARSLDKADERDTREWVRQLGLDQEMSKLRAQKDAREAEAHGWMAALQPDKQREQKGRAAKASADALSSAVKAQFAGEQEAAKLGLTNEKRRTERAKQANQAAGARKSNAQAAAAGGEFVVYDKEGNVHRYRTKAAAEYATLQFGTNGKVSIEDVNTTTKTSPNPYDDGKQTTKTTTTTTTKTTKKKAQVVSVKPTERKGKKGDVVIN